ncbi:MAG TPA: OmpA family protein [Puia sp.]|nr:OmpA family protein [Puia sp.]
MRLRCHLILLYPLLMLACLAHSQQRQRDTLILHFSLDRYVIQPGDPQFNHLRSTLGSKKIDSVFITGYTDKTGTLTHNLHLSAQRAANAGRYLQNLLSSGGDNDRWQIAGGGIAPTPDQSDSANRRAEIIISYIAAAPPVAASHPDTTQLTTARTDGNQSTARTDSSQTTGTPGDSTQPTAVISLQHINFVLDTPIPTDATRMILPGYVTQLQQYKDRHLEIDGYVNSFVPLRGPKDPLFILSVKRAKYIYDYLVDAGFDPNKLTYKGMGNASPINPDPATREEMNANMRVEIKVY